MQTTRKSNREAVVMKGFVNAYKALGLTADHAARILGIGRSTLVRKQDGFDPNSKETELQILFIRLYRSLFALMGGDLRAMQHWYKNTNSHLRGAPKDLCLTVTGLVHTNEYLDGMRGKI